MLALQNDNKGSAKLSVTDYFGSLKVGDSVMYDSDAFGERLHVLTVTKVTETLIVVGDMKFRRTTGYQTGNTNKFHFPRLKVMTEDDWLKFRDNIRRSKLMVYIKDNLVVLSTEELQDLVTKVMSKKAEVKK